MDIVPVKKYRKRDTRCEQNRRKVIYIMNCESRRKVKNSHNIL